MTAKNFGCKLALSGNVQGILEDEDMDGMVRHNMVEEEGRKDVHDMEEEVEVDNMVHNVDSASA